MSGATLWRRRLYAEATAACWYFLLPRWRQTLCYFLGVMSEWFSTKALFVALHGDILECMGTCLVVTAGAHVLLASSREKPGMCSTPWMCSMVPSAQQRLSSLKRPQCWDGETLSLIDHFLPTGFLFTFKNSIYCHKTNMLFIIKTNFTQTSKSTKHNTVL